MPLQGNLLQGFATSKHKSFVVAQEGRNELAMALRNNGDENVGVGDVEVQASPPSAGFMRRASSIMMKDPTVVPATSIDGDAALSEGQESMGDEFQVHLLDYALKSGSRSKFQPKALLYPGASHAMEISCRARRTTCIHLETTSLSHGDPRYPCIIMDPHPRPLQQQQQAGGASGSGGKEEEAEFSNVLSPRQNRSDLDVFFRSSMGCTSWLEEDDEPGPEVPSLLGCDHLFW